MIPNLHNVVPGELWRGGEPQAHADWDSLYRLGVRYVVQLDYFDATYPRSIGMTVYQFPLSSFRQFFRLWGSNYIKNWAVHAIVEMGRPGTFVHCKHGVDRTGFVVAMWRWLKGMPKADAFAEAVLYGFSGEAALQSAWDELPENPKDL